MSLRKYKIFSLKDKFKAQAEDEIKSLKKIVSGEKPKKAKAKSVEKIKSKKK